MSTTPDVEKIAREKAAEVGYRIIKSGRIVAFGDLEQDFLGVAAQARAPLVKELTLAAESAYQLCLMIEEIPSSIKQTAASVFAVNLRKKLADAAVLTGIGEK